MYEHHSCMSFYLSLSSTTVQNFCCLWLLSSLPSHYEGKLTVCQSVSPSVRQSISPSLRQFVSLSVRQSNSLSVRQSNSLSVRQSVSPSVRQSVSSRYYKIAHEVVAPRPVKGACMAITLRTLCCVLTYIQLYISSVL